MRPLRAWGFGFLLPVLAHATATEHDVLEGYNALAAGKCRSVSLSEDGVLAPGPAVGTLAELGAQEAWSAVARPDGSIWVGTAPEGKLLRVSADGSVKTLAKFDESHLYAMAAGNHGEVYVGTSPDGKIYQVNPDGKTQVYFEPKEKYIWALLAAPDGTLYAGTGTKGRIYRVTGSGKGEVWYASNETHIRTLALDKNGALLAGTSGSGYLMRINGKDQAVVLADTDKEEVNQIRVAADGTIYFTATGTAPGGTVAAKMEKPAPSEDGPTLQLRDLLVTNGQKGGGESSAAPKKSEGASALYRLDATLYPQLLWSTKDTILSLAWSERDGAAWIGTGSEGYVYRVTSHGEATRLARIDSDSVTALAVSGDEMILAASNPGRLFHLGHATSQPGVYESDVIDSESFARWGAVTIGASDLDSVKILTRTGNTAKPDKTWYPWQETSNGRTQSPPARYEQVQLQIGAGTVDKIDAAYQARNQAPHLDLVRVLPVGVGYAPVQSPPSGPVPRGADQLLSAPDKADADAKIQTRWQAVSAPGLRTVVWQASDPNGDDLAYTVSWRKKGETKWHELAPETRDRVVSWDTSGWADGSYELRVVASDAGDNAAGEGLQDTAISREMVIDHTPPQIQVISPSGEAVEFTVVDSLSGLKSVTVSTNGRDYKALPPVDGILDAGTKRFVAKISPGQTLFIRAEDASGNVAGRQVGD